METGNLAACTGYGPFNEAQTEGSLTLGGRSPSGASPSPAAFGPSSETCRVGFRV